MNTQAHLLPAGQVGLQSGGQLRQGPDARWQNDWGGALASEQAPGGATLAHYSSSHCLIYSLHVLTCKMEGRCHRGGCIQYAVQDSCAAFTEQAASSLSFSFVIFQAAQNKEARPPTEHAVASYIRQDAAWQGGGWMVSGRLGSGKMPSPCREESQTPGAAARPVCSAGQWGWGPRA